MRHCRTAGEEGGRAGTRRDRSKSGGTQYMAASPDPEYPFYVDMFRRVEWEGVATPFPHCPLVLVPQCDQRIESRRTAGWAIRRGETDGEQT